MNTGQGKNELIAAQTCQGVAPAHHGLKTARQLTQELIAHTVSERIIDPLEVIEIEKNQRDFFAIALGGGQQLAKAVMQQTAIGQAGQGIEICQLANALLGFLVLRHIQNGADDGGGAIEQDRANEELGRKRAAVIAPTQHLAPFGRTLGIGEEQLFAQPVVMRRFQQIKHGTPGKRIARQEDVTQKAVGVADAPALLDEDTDLCRLDGSVEKRRGDTMRHPDNRTNETTRFGSGHAFPFNASRARAASV